MADQFREAEATFSLLREKFQEKKISPQEFADSLKQLRIKDEEGRFWVIGAQSGKWYAFDNGEWVEAKPPSQMEKKAICIACGFENDIEAEFCARCGSRGDDSVPEALTGTNGTGPGTAAESAVSKPGSEIAVRSVDMISFLWFFGDHQGDLLGGLGFSIVGGILGFGIGAGPGAAAAAVSNGILSLIGGIR